MSSDSYRETIKSVIENAIKDEQYFLDDGIGCLDKTRAYLLLETLGVRQKIEHHLQK